MVAWFGDWKIRQPKKLIIETHLIEKTSITKKMLIE